MAYNLTRYANTTLVPDNGVTPIANIVLPGKNYLGYGQPVDQSLLNMVENFAGPSAPSNPIIGQMWFDTNTFSMRYNDGTQTVAHWTTVATLGGNIVADGITANVIDTGNITANNITGGNITGNIGGTLFYKVTFNNSGAGNASGNVYDASAHKLVSWNTVGAAKGDTNGDVTGNVLGTVLGNIGPIPNANVFITGGTAGQFLQTNGSGNLSWATVSAGATTASSVTSVPAGNLVATDVQAALNELDSEKATLASPTLTGVPAAPTAAVGTNTTQIATTAFVQAEIASAVPTASETVAGKVELATAAEVLAGTDTTRAVTPLGLKGALDTKSSGPASSTDNAIVRFDGTTGKIIQDSVVIISDTGDITGVVGLTVGGVSTLGPVGNVKITGGTNGQVLTTDGTGTLSWTTVSAGGGGSGDVTGPASSTDNAVVRYDLTTGKIIQNSVVIISDAGAVTGVTTLAASTSVQTPVLTTGAAATAGTVTGTWTLSAGSTLNATYADLAERHHSDAEYPVGTVMTVGGVNEVTECQVSQMALGVISDQYAYLMNSEAGPDETHPAVGYLGRVYVRVVGPVTKHQRIAPSGGGTAVAADKNSFGWALETNTLVGEKLVLCLIK